ncbi:MAG: dihydroorotate dehydrogenase electron transfer subunit [Coriobacteriia bacterium]|nr:dihydroorotate dehydrogenase electron transfer subunit [Coriobacteriia bacterium]
MYEPVEVVSNEAVAADVYRLRLRAPQTAPLVRGGQFVHLRLNRHAAHTPLLRRPLSVCQVYGDELLIMYAVVGTGTEVLAGKAVGDTSMDIIGPLGSCWPIEEDVRTPLIVGGGLGIAPLGMLAHAFRDRGINVKIIQAAQTAERLIVREAHERVKRDIVFATDDGTCGYHGIVTDLVREALAERAEGAERTGDTAEAATMFDVAYVCGPEPMQKAVSEVLLQAGVRTYVSFERRMACGVGACLGCTVPTIDGLKRACADGPVFAAEEVCFDDAIASRVH